VEGLGAGLVKWIYGGGGSGLQLERGGGRQEWGGPAGKNGGGAKVLGFTCKCQKGKEKVKSKIIINK
jgi:hypothetical protein